MAIKTALDVFRISGGKEMTDELLIQYITEHDTLVTNRYQALWDAYNNAYDIFDTSKVAAKAQWKPDVRVSVNFGKNLVDIFEGFFLGIPVKVTSADERVAEYVSSVNDLNDNEDLESELSTLSSIFGTSFRIVFVNEDGDIGTAYLSPIDAFMVYDDAIKPAPRYFIRTYTDDEDVRHGSISDETTVRYFTISGSGVVWDDEHEHGFAGVPAVEYPMNSNRRGLIEDVLSLINEYNKALSEKSNDVEAFAEAYLKVFGAKVDAEVLQFIRQNRILNFDGRDGTKVIAEFMQKPSGDETQENLLNRIERLIYTIAMVCNINDDNFATSSGIALKYKMLPMINLAAKKWRKFQSCQNRYWKLVCSNPVTPLGEDDWSTLRYTHTLNYPSNVYEEAETAEKLTGITSKKTQLSVLSVVDDVDAELEQIEKEGSGEDPESPPDGNDKTDVSIDIE